jgi:hypothetical protein
VNLTKAEALQSCLRKESALAQSDEKAVSTFDLQQELPVPKQITGPGFYKRKM